MQAAMPGLVSVRDPTEPVNGTMPGGAKIFKSPPPRGHESAHLHLGTPQRGRQPTYLVKHMCDPIVGDQVRFYNLGLIDIINILPNVNSQCRSPQGLQFLAVSKEREVA